MIGHVYCAQAGLERLYKMKVSHRKQSLRNAEINAEKIITVKSECTEKSSKPWPQLKTKPTLILSL